MAIKMIKSNFKEKTELRSAITKVSFQLVGYTMTAVHTIRDLYSHNVTGSFQGVKEFVDFVVQKKTT